MVDKSNPIMDNISDSVKKYFEKIKKASPILDARYEACDEFGHISANEENNLCNYCYRKLDYDIAIGWKNGKSEDGFSLSRTINSGAGIKKRGYAINRQKAFDHMDGLRKIIIEYNL